jgi:hypothetical protein
MKKSKQFIRKSEDDWEFVGDGGTWKQSFWCLVGIVNSQDHVRPESD